MQLLSPLTLLPLLMVVSVFAAPNVLYDKCIQDEVKTYEKYKEKTQVYAKAECMARYDMKSKSEFDLSTQMLYRVLTASIVGDQIALLGNGNLGEKPMAFR